MAQDDYSMDRPRPADASVALRPMAWGVLAVVAIGAFIVVDRLWLRAGEGIALADYMTATVERGRLAIEVRGAGALEPVSERWITAEVGGAVAQIFVRAGQEVEAGRLILRLVDPRLHQAVTQRRLELAEVTAQHRQQLASFTDRRLGAEARVLEMQANFEEAQLRLEAQSQLRAQNAVSEIDYKSSEIRTQQAETSLAFERRRFAELDAALTAEKAASEARVATRQLALEEAEAQVAALDVAADISGTVRELLVEPGARVAAGGQVARVVDAASLMAVVRVPESYASHLTVGQPARIAVLSAELAAVVTRVDPAVSQGSVAVDLELFGDLPAGARPDLSVRATITVAELDDALFVRRPVHVQETSTADVFRLAEDAGVATRTAVRFGLGTLKHIEVRDGLAAGDTLILGDTSRFDDAETIAVR